MKIIWLKLSIIFLLFFHSLYAQKLIYHTTARQSKPFVFMENKGQLADQDGKVLHDIRYYAKSNNGVNIYCEKDRIGFVFTKELPLCPKGGRYDHHFSKSILCTSINQPFIKGQNNKNSPKQKFPLEPVPITREDLGVETSRMEMQFLNANPDVQTISEDPNEYYENYYLAHCPDGITAHGFKKITYKNIYPKIDLVLSCLDQKMEYSFIVNPGGKVSDIKIKWNGVDSFLGEGDPGHLHLTNQLGYLDESGLKAFDETGTPMNTNYLFDRDITGFNVGEYDKGKILTIDPTLVWATYFGGSGGDISSSICCDKIGNIVIIGSTNSRTGIATSGSYVSNYPGSYNLSSTFIAKFTTNGKILWGTYFDRRIGLTDIKTDSSNNLIVVGNSDSTGLATSGAYQTAVAGKIDVYLAKLNSNGFRIWSTYYGGTDNDQAAALSIDYNNYIYITGSTRSTTGIASSGAYQTSYSGSTNNTLGDCFIAKFSNGGSFKWGSYFGGNGGEQGSSIANDKNGNAIIGGYTESSSGIATSGAYQTSLSSTGNGYIANFSSSGKLNWCTYFGGNYGANAEGIASDTSGNIFVTGATGSTTGIATSGAYQTVNTGRWSNLYVAKFSNSGSLKWSTYYGGDAQTDFNHIAIDKFGNSYVISTSQSITGIASSGAYQSYYAGAVDVIFAKFSVSGVFLYGTYYGGKSVEWSEGIAIDQYCNVFITGLTSSSSNISTPGSYQTKYADSTDAFLVKFKNYFNDAGICSIVNPVSILCKGSFPVKVKLKNYGSLDLKSVNINWSVNGKKQTPYKWTGSLHQDSTALVSIGNFSFFVGNDTLKAWTSDPNNVYDSVQINDSSFTVDTVYTVPMPVAGGNFTICNGGSYVLGTSGKKNHSYSWTSNPVGFNSNSGAPTVSPSVSTTYYLTENIINSAGCIAKDSTIINVIPKPGAYTGGNRNICQNDSAIIGGTSVAGHKYQWTSNPSGFYSSKSNPKILPGTKTTYYLTETDTTYGCSNNDSMTIIVLAIPTVGAGIDQEICFGETAKLGTKKISGYSYRWTSLPIGFISDSSMNLISPAITTVYYLVGTLNSTGCSKTDSIKIKVDPLPAARTGGNKSICKGSSITLGDSAVPGNLYSWTSFPSGFTSSLSNPSVTPPKDSLNYTTYYLTETNPITGCKKSDSAVISFVRVPYVDAGGNHTICMGQNVWLGGRLSSVGVIQYWTAHKDSVFSFYDRILVTPSLTITFYEHAQYFNSKQCEAIDSAKITVLPIPKAKTIPDTVICGGSTLKIGNNAFPGNHYSWSTKPAGFTDTSSNPTVSPDITTTYYLTESNQGCSIMDSVVITVNPLPKPIAGPAYITCSGDKVTVGKDSGEGGKYFSWKSDPPRSYSNQPKIIVNPLLTTRYTIFETDSISGCTGKDSTIIYVNPLPNPSIQGNSKLCGIIPAGYTTKNDSGASYKWTMQSGKIISGQGTNKVNLEPDLGYDSIFVLETDANGCKNTAVFKVMVNGLPDARWGLASDSPVSVFKALDSFEQYYHWDFGDGATGSSYLEHHRYPFSKDSFVNVSLTVATAFGCTSTFDSIIKIRYIKPETFSIQVFPNPFNEFTTIKIDLDKPARIRIFAFDAIGRYFGKITDVNQSIGTTLYPFVSDKYQLASEVYFLEILVDEKVFVFPVMRVN
jgi:hypothetical protein